MNFTDSDSISPLGLKWSRIDTTVAIDFDDFFDLYLAGSAVETTLLCASCSEDTPCNNEGVCDFETGECSCETGFEGPLCEVEPPCVTTGNCSGLVV